MDGRSDEDRADLSHAGWVVIQRRAESCMVSRASKTRPLIDHPQKWSSRLLYAAISAAPETVGVPAL